MPDGENRGTLQRCIETGASAAVAEESESAAPGLLAFSLLLVALPCVLFVGRMNKWLGLGVCVVVGVVLSFILPIETDKKPDEGA